MKVGLIGLGMMGRHHARLLNAIDTVDFVGAFDPAGDRHQAVPPGLLVNSFEGLLARDLEAAVVAVPTRHHHDVAVALARAGIPTLIEKPLAADTSTARAIRDIFAEEQVYGAVGHVERFNPALVEMKRRLEQGELGQAFGIWTERVGPYPNRIDDVGVVKDLATHDIDLAHWLGDGRFERLEAVTSHRMGREHEDMVHIIGTLTSGIVVAANVNWLTPTKRRTLTMIGEKGAFVSDLLGADLTFHANSAVSPTEWEEMARLRGVSEGHTIKFAFAKQEPLRAELETFIGALAHKPTSNLVSLDDGVAIVETAERVLDSARKDGALR
jgi:UDP-N-acetylglucosamine 3-dehydrogenase